MKTGFSRISKLAARLLFLFIILQIGAILLTACELPWEKISMADQAKTAVAEESTRIWAMQTLTALAPTATPTPLQSPTTKPTTTSTPSAAPDTPTPSPSPSPTLEATLIDTVFYNMTEDGYYTFLRFYPDGKVTQSTYKFDPPKELDEAYGVAKESLDPGYEYAKVGDYLILGDVITITFTGGSWGTRSGTYTQDVITIEAPDGSSVLYNHYEGEV